MTADEERGGGRVVPMSLERASTGGGAASAEKDGWRAGRVQAYAGVLALYAANKVLEVVCLAVGITDFPPPLIGLFLIVAALLAAPEAAAQRCHSTMHPGVQWVAHRWLTVFYAPALVTVPMAVGPLTGFTLVKAVLVICIGVPMVLFVAASVAVLIRRATGTELEPFPHHHESIRFSAMHFSAWGGVAAVSLLLTLLLHSSTARFTAFAFLLAVTLLFYMGGMMLPERVKRIVHPSLVCALVPNAACALHGAVTGVGYWGTLGLYLTRGRDGWYGPGDFLFTFLGVVILSFAFKIFEQWPVMRRHWPELLGGTCCGALFSLLSTAGMARLAQLPPDVALGLVPRSVTLALALPIADQLGAPLPITAAAVPLTGLIGAPLVQQLLNLFGFGDPIARGLAAAACAHGLGTAALSSKEPETLPFCGLSYALSGIMSTLLCSIPWLRALIILITG